MHVHISDALGHEHWSEFTYFVYKNKTDLAVLSRRNAASITQWSHFDLAGVGTAWIEEYDASGSLMANSGDRCMCASCRGFRELEQHHTFKNVTHDLRAACQNMSAQHYSVVNYNREYHTVEFRLFAGTMRADEFFAQLEFVKSVIEFTDPVRNYHHETQCNMEQYKRWLHTRRLRTLEKYIDRLLPVTDAKIAPVREIA
jgi:hypothetical protein